MFLRLGGAHPNGRGPKVYERAEIKDLLAYLRVAYNSADQASLRRVINVPRRGIGDGTLRRLEAWAEVERVSLWDALRRAGDAGLGPQLRRAAAEFVGLV